MQSISVIIPTYNEAENVGALLAELTITLAGLEHQIIVVDDNSPDGTYQVVKEMSAKDPHVRGIRRSGKLGLASAVLEGFAASNGDLVVMMDSDLSHRPQDLTSLLEGARDADIVIGSRYVEGGAITGWSPLRHLASRTAIWLSRAFLGLSIRDTTSGFVLFRRGILDPLVVMISPVGFKLLLEVLALSPQARVKEVPITFVNRKKGKSKFGPAEVLTFLRLCLALRRQRKGTAAAPL